MKFSESTPRAPFGRGRLLAMLLTCLLCSLAAANYGLAAEAAHLTVGPRQIGVTASAPGVTFMSLRIVGPDGMVVCNANSAGEPLNWQLPAGVADGYYTYEARAGFAAKRSHDPGASATPASSPQPPWSLSGSVLIRDGKLVDPTAKELSLLRTIGSLVAEAADEVMDFLVAPAAADQLFSDDLIVQGSQCVGIDCVNGENFGYDTIRLKENNLRILFSDTSYSSSFPSTDWQITINDTNNGGLNRFSIEDITSARTPFTILGSAPSNSLWINTSGNVGLGTSTPATKLHLQNGDTPTIRLEQDGSSGWSPLAWDIGANDANVFIRDEDGSNRTPFKILANSADNTLVITNGKVGVNTATPSQALHVVGNAYISANLELGSSRELKDNIRPLQADEALQALANLEPVHYSYKIAPEEESLGFIAEDVPELVATKDRKSLSPMDLVAVLARVVQEQQKTIDALSGRMVALEAEVRQATMVGQLPATRGEKSAPGRPLVAKAEANSHQ